MGVEQDVELSVKQQMAEAGKTLQDKLQQQNAIEQDIAKELAGLQAALANLERLENQLQSEQSAPDAEQRRQEARAEVAQREARLQDLQQQADTLLKEMQEAHAKARAASPYELTKNNKFSLPKWAVNLCVGLVITAMIVVMLPATWPIWAAVGVGALTAAAAIAVVNYTPIGKLWLGAKTLSLWTTNAVVALGKGLFNIVTESSLDYASAMQAELKGDHKIPVWAKAESAQAFALQATNEVEDKLLNNLGDGILDFRRVDDEKAKVQTEKQKQDGTRSDYEQWKDIQPRWIGLEADLMSEVIVDFTVAASEPLTPKMGKADAVQEAFKVLQSIHQDLQPALAAAKGNPQQLAAVQRSFVSAQYQFYKLLEDKGLVDEARARHPKAMEHIDNMLGIKPWERKAYTQYKQQTQEWVKWLEQRQVDILKDKDMNGEQRTRAMTLLSLLYDYAGKVVRDSDNPHGLSQTATGLNKSDAMYLAAALGTDMDINSPEFSGVLVSQKAAVAQPLPEYAKLADACKQAIGSTDIHRLGAKLLQAHIAQGWLPSKSSGSAKQVLALLNTIEKSDWTGEAKTRRMLYVLDGYAQYLREHDGDKRLYANVTAMVAALHDKLGSDAAALPMHKVFADIRAHLDGQPYKAEPAYNTELAKVLGDRLSHGKRIDDLLQASEQEQLTLLDRELGDLGGKITQLTEELQHTTAHRVTDENRLADTLVSAESALTAMQERVEYRGVRIDAYTPTVWNSIKTSVFPWFNEDLVKQKAEHQESKQVLNQSQWRLAQLKAAYGEVTNVEELTRYMTNMDAQVAAQVEPSKIAEYLHAQIVFLEGLQGPDTRYPEKVVEILRGKQEALQTQLKSLASYSSDDQIQLRALYQQLDSLRDLLADGSLDAKTRQQVKTKYDALQNDVTEKNSVLHAKCAPTEHAGQLEAWVQARKQEIAESKESKGPDGKSTLGSLQEMYHDTIWMMYHVECEIEQAQKQGKGDSEEVKTLTTYHEAAIKFVTAFDQGFTEKGARDNLLKAAKDLIGVVDEPKTLLTANSEVIKLKEVLLDAQGIRNAERNIASLGENLTKLQSVAFQAKSHQVVSQLSDVAKDAFTALDVAHQRYEDATALLNKSQIPAKEMFAAFAALHEACDAAGRQVGALQQSVQTKIAENAQKAEIKPPSLWKRIVAGVRAALSGGHTTVKQSETIVDQPGNPFAEPTTLLSVTPIIESPTSSPAVAGVTPVSSDSSAARVIRYTENNGKPLFGLTQDMFPPAKVDVLKPATTSDLTVAAEQQTKASLLRNQTL